jgi:hypothetical protein
MAGQSLPHTTNHDDGFPDIVWRHPLSGHVLIWEMGGLNAAQQPSGSVYKDTHLVDSGGIPPTWKIVGSGRFTPDEDIDLLWQDRTDGRLVVWPMHGFTREPNGVYLTDYLTDANYWVGAVGDYNGDGVTDLIWRHQTEQRCVAYWLMEFRSGAYRSIVPSGQPIPPLGCVVEQAPADFPWQIAAPR